MLMFNSTIFLTLHKDRTPVLVFPSRILCATPIEERNQLANGKSLVLIEGGIQLMVSETLQEIKDIVDPPRH